MDVIDECLRKRSAIVRREVMLLDAGQGVTHLGVSVSPLFDPSRASRTARSACSPI